MPSHRVNEPLTSTVGASPTISTTETTLDQGIYLNALVADVASTGGVSGYTGQWPTTPLGSDATATTWQGLSKTSYTYVATLPATLAADSSFWTFSNGYYSKFASFLLNQA